MNCRKFKFYFKLGNYYLRTQYTFVNVSVYLVIFNRKKTLFILLRFIIIYFEHSKF
jgi:hypothetical protein